MGAVSGHLCVCGANCDVLFGVSYDTAHAVMRWRGLCGCLWWLREAQSLLVAGRAESGELSTETSVVGFGGFFGCFPPLGVVGVPVDGCFEACPNVAVLRLPAEFGAQFGGVDGIA